MSAVELAGVIVKEVGEGAWKVMFKLGEAVWCWRALRSRFMIQVCWTQLALEDICIYRAIALECVSGDSSKPAILCDTFLDLGHHR